MSKPVVAEPIQSDLINKTNESSQPTIVAEPIDYNFVKKPREYDIVSQPRKLSFLSPKGVKLWVYIFVGILTVTIPSLITLIVLTYANFFKADWMTNRCHLQMLPIAGFIQREDNESILQATGKNFEYCLNDFYKKSMETQLSPLLDIQMILNEGISVLNIVLEDIAIAANATLAEISKIIGGGVNTVEDVAVLLYYGFILVYDIFQKILMALFSSLQFSLTGMTWGTLFIKLLYSAMMMIIIVFYAASVVPILSLIWLIWPILILILFTLMLVVSIQFKSWVFIIIDAVSSAEPFTTMKPLISKPSLSLCFDKETLLRTSTGRKKRICQLKPGDILFNGDMITAVFKTVAPATMFNLNGIIVSGDHYVYSGKWIKVKNHPESVLIPYTGRYLYCLNTTSKRIFIDDSRGQQMFMDWDELSSSKTKHVLRCLQATDTKQIHTFEKGFNKRFRVKTIDGYKKMGSLRPGDRLHDVSVMAVVRMKGRSKFRDLYHLVTDKGYFKNKQSFKDYNFNIDKLFYMS